MDRNPINDWKVLIANDRISFLGGGAEESKQGGESRYGPITNIIIDDDGTVTVSLGHVSEWDAARQEWFIPRDKTGPGEIKFKASNVTNYKDWFASRRMVQFRAGKVLITLYTQKHEFVRLRSNPTRR